MRKDPLDVIDNAGKVQLLFKRLTNPEVRVWLCGYRYIPLLLLTCMKSCTGLVVSLLCLEDVGTTALSPSYTCVLQFMRREEEAKRKKEEEEKKAKESGDQRGSMKAGSWGGLPGGRR